jgi:hypothetical protein
MVLPGPSALTDKDDQVSKDVRMDSNSGSRHGDDRPWRAAALVGALAVTALLAAACGGGSSGASSGQDTTAQLQAFVSCMRHHGDPSFYFAAGTTSPAPPATPSPGTAHGPGLIMTQIDGDTIAWEPGSPAFEAASKACKHLSSLFLPSGTPPPPSHQQYLNELKSVDCLRSHGFPNWPDPPTRMLVGRVLPVGVDTSSPQFQAAVKKCGQS